MPQVHFAASVLLFYAVHAPSVLTLRQGHQANTKYMHSESWRRNMDAALFMQKTLNVNGKTLEAHFSKIITDKNIFFMMIEHF